MPAADKQISQGATAPQCCEFLVNYFVVHLTGSTPNASISCIVYGEIDHSKPKPWKDGFIYDMTALTQMDEIVHMLAERGVSDPKAALDAMLSL